MRFKGWRCHGRTCSANWIKKTAKVVVKEQQPESNFCASWIVCRISKKIQSRSKKEVKVEADRIYLRAIHAKFRLCLSWGSGPIDKKWGKFFPFCGWNVDQVPLPFFVLKMKLVKYRVQSGLDCTSGIWDDKTIWHPLRIPFRAEGTQPKPTIIFRGQGTRLSQLEKEAWDPIFIVMLQKCNKYNLFISTFPSLNFGGRWYS